MCEDISIESKVSVSFMILAAICITLAYALSLPTGGVPEGFSASLFFLIATGVVLIVGTIVLIVVTIKDMDYLPTLLDPVTYRRTVFKYFYTHDLVLPGWKKYYIVIRGDNYIDVVITVYDDGSTDVKFRDNKRLLYNNSVSEIGIYFTLREVLPNIKYKDIVFGSATEISERVYNIMLSDGSTYYVNVSERTAQKYSEGIE